MSQIGMILNCFSVAFVATTIHDGGSWRGFALAHKHRVVCRITSKRMANCGMVSAIFAYKRKRGQRGIAMPHNGIHGPLSVAARNMKCGCSRRRFPCRPDCCIMAPSFHMAPYRCSWQAWHEAVVCNFVCNESHRTIRRVDGARHA